MVFMRNSKNKTNTIITMSSMNEYAVKNLCSWNYPQPYDTYNFMSYEEAVQSNAAILNKKNWDNYLCFWENNVLTAYIKFYIYSKKLMIGIGLSPEMCGKGLGGFYLKKGIDEANKRYPDKALWVQVRSWNQRAISCYESCGFKKQYKESIKDKNNDYTEFVFMCLEQKTVC